MGEDGGATPDQPQRPTLLSSSLGAAVTGALAGIVGTLAVTALVAPRPAGTVVERRETPAPVVIEPDTTAIQAEVNRITLDAARHIEQLTSDATARIDAALARLEALPIPAPAEHTDPSPPPEATQTAELEPDAGPTPDPQPAQVPTQTPTQTPSQTPSQNPAPTQIPTSTQPWEPASPTPTEVLRSVRTVNVNAATSEELQVLPGIGPARARAIIESRNTDGPFRSLDDLQRVSGIGPKTAENLTGLVRFN